MEKVEILCEYKHFFAVYKPAGILSEKAENGKDEDMVTILSQMCGKEVFPVHRLDKETAGAMIYARDRVGAAKLSAVISSGAFHKTYLAVCEGEPTEERGELHDLLFFDRRKNKSYVVDRMRTGVKEASLAYEVLGKETIGDIRCSLLQIRLFTGRTHQIRVQLASRRLPLVGDARYGAKIKMPLALFSKRIEFRDPFDGKSVIHECSPTGSQDAFSRFPQEKS